MANTTQLLMDRVQQLSQEEQERLLKMIGEPHKTEVSDPKIELQKSTMPPKEQRLIRRLRALPPAERLRLMTESADKAAQNGYGTSDLFADED